MKKVLFVATVVKTHIMVFHIPYLKWFKENGYETYVCARNDFENKDDCIIPYCDHYIDLPFERTPLKLNNLKTYKRLKDIIDSNEFEIIHCHTPMGGVLARLAARSHRKKKTKLVYTAHGFHFFKGASIKNWLIFYPVEKYLSKYTDCLITINDEDYNIAKKSFMSSRVELVNGVGIDLNKFKPQKVENKYTLRQKYGYSRKNFILIYVGELSYRKHQDMIINVINRLKNRIPNLKLLLVGSGDYLTKYKQLVNDLKIKNYVDFLGYRSDICNLMTLSDVAVSTSRQEGLPVNVMEAMSIGLPLVVTDCRGNRDLVTNNKNGYVIDLMNTDDFANAILTLYNDPVKRQVFGNNSIKLVKKYSLENINKKMVKIYNDFLNRHS